MRVLVVAALIAGVPARIPILPIGINSLIAFLCAMCVHRIACGAPAWLRRP